MSSFHKYPAYPPTSKLNHTDGQERATVLTEGKVMVTMTRGEPCRDIMSLDDWLILADGAMMYGTMPPSSSPQTAEDQAQIDRNAFYADADRAQARAADAEANADAIRNAREYQTTGSDMAAAEDTAPDGSITADPPFALKPSVFGTVLRWESTDSDTLGDHVEAVFTEQGIVQVKSYLHEHTSESTNIVVSTNNKLFPTYFDWQQTLRWRGIVTMTHPKVPDSAPIELKPEEVGTVFRWNSLETEGDYVVAVQTAKGVLQVKSHLHLPNAEEVTVNTKKTLFPTYMDWAKTLPSCSGVTMTPPDKRSQGERLAAKPLAEGLSDPMKLKDIMDRFKIHECAYREQSVEERLASAISLVNYSRNEFNKLSIDAVLKDPVHMKLLCRYVREASFLAGHKRTLSEEKAAEKAIRVIPNPRRNIKVFLSGVWYYITYFKDGDQDTMVLLGPSWPPPQHQVLRFDSFTKMGVSEVHVLCRGVTHKVKV